MFIGFYIPASGPWVLGWGAWDDLSWKTYVTGTSTTKNLGGSSAHWPFYHCHNILARKIWTRFRGEHQKITSYTATYDINAYHGHIHRNCDKHQQQLGHNFSEYTDINFHIIRDKQNHDGDIHFHHVCNQQHQRQWHKYKWHNYSIFLYHKSVKHENIHFHYVYN